MAWIYLLLAGFLEIVWSFTMKQSTGFTKLVPTSITIIAMISSVVFLSMAMKTLPLGTAYTIWTGIGAVGAFLLGIILLGEPTNLFRIAAAILIIIGLIMLKLSA